MIQRIQSIFLFLVAASMVTLLFFPIWNKVDVEKRELVKITALQFTHETENIDTKEITVIAESHTFYIAILAILAAAVAVYSIFRYDNRLLQMKLGALNSLLMGSMIGVIMYFVFHAEKIIIPQVQGNYLFAFYLGISGLMFNLLANRFIRKDDKLVKSADRLR